MIIELHGGQFRNKGAHKMLLAAMEGLRSCIPNVSFAVDTAYCTAEDMRANRLLSVWPPRGWLSGRQFRHRLLAQRLANVLPRSAIPDRAMRVRDVDAFVDPAGFAYSDQWGSRPCVNVSMLARYFRKRGKPVVFLPQALGPFGSRTNAKGFRNILKAAHLVYARDAQSYEYADSLNAGAVSLRRAPDITLFHDARLRPVCPNEHTPHAYIVPSVRMVGRNRGSEYLENLRHAATFLDRNSVKPILLVHDASGDDRRLAMEVVDTSDIELSIVEETDPWEIKRLIGESTFVVGSRYHALVAAFSKGVPAIAMGWSHKYDMLFAEFGMQRFVIEPWDRYSLEQGIVELCSSSNIALREILCERLTVLAEINRAMWAEIGRLLQR